ncbi:DsbA family protein [Massilia sp. GCM10023247]|uniref:DsbA family protein n=1 Tax=Massilia sp. GCM10023247 TaxID=3252643 RepID=UPI00361706EF
MEERVRITENDHIRGNRDAELVLVEYADFACPYCARAHKALTDLQRQHGERLTLVYRHLPLTDLHPFAQPAAEAAEAAGAQGKFWEMHDALFENQGMLDEDALPALAANLRLDAERFRSEFEGGRHRPRVQADMQEAHGAGARGTPTFFINGERYHGDSDHASLSAAIGKALDGA